jgi:hypothetical protein
VPPGWAVTTATAGSVAELEHGWTGIDRAADHAAWAARPNGAPVLASLHGQVMAAGTAAGPAWQFGLMRLATSPAADDAAAGGAALAVLAALPALAGLDGPEPSVTVCLPAPHPATRPLLAAGWRISDRDQYMASEPGLVDPRRAVPSPSSG